MTIVALVSRDEFFDRLVLKGGNSIGHVGATMVRGSLDIDFSVDGSLDDLGTLSEIQCLFEEMLRTTFLEAGFRVFDVSLTRQPPNMREDVLGPFWGGYRLEFKVLEVDRFARLSEDDRRRQAIVVGPGDTRRFRVDLSAHEFCANKQLTEVDGYNVYVYSDRMIVCEKIRAICQQMPQYRDAVKSKSARPRARDFFDIFHVISELDIPFDDEFWHILKHVFDAKQVPLSLLGQISENREFHRDDFSSVRDTVFADVELAGFDFYVDFLVDCLAPLQPRWVEKPPSG